MDIARLKPAFHSPRRSPPRRGLEGSADSAEGPPLRVQLRQRREGRRAACLPAIVGLLALAACAPRYPAIADLGGDAAFKAHIAQRYGPGTPAVRLRDELAREGFTLLEEPLTRTASAVWRPANLPCYSETRIDWTEDRYGRIAVIQAARHSCT